MDLLYSMSIRNIFKKNSQRKFLDYKNIHNFVNCFCDAVEHDINVVLYQDIVSVARNSRRK